jgi:uncharacterized protein (DUF58 family)
VVYVLLGLSLLAAVVSGHPLYYRLTYLWGLFLLVNWIWARLSLRQVDLQRTARTHRAQVGQVFTERFRVWNGSRWFRLWLEVRDESPLPNSRGSRVLSLIGGHEQRSYLSRTGLVQRGVFPLGPTRLISGDPFGLFTRERSVPPAASLMVYPRLIPVRAFPHPPGLLPGGEALRRKTHQVTPSAAGVREYAPGDPLSRIHWLSTARRRRFMVKEFELDPMADVWLFVDAARVVQAARPYTYGEKDVERFWLPGEVFRLPPATIEYAVTLAASIARYYLRRRCAVGLVAQGQTLTVLPPDRGGRQLNKILEALALLRGEGKLPVSGLLLAQSQHITRGSTVVLITPDNREEVAMGVDQVIRRGLRPVVVLLDALSFGGAPGAERLKATLQSLGVPLYFVHEGDDLEHIFSRRIPFDLSPQRVIGSQTRPAPSGYPSR